MVDNLKRMVLGQLVRVLQSGREEGQHAGKEIRAGPRTLKDGSDHKAASEGVGAARTSAPKLSTSGPGQCILAQQ